MKRIRCKNEDKELQSVLEQNLDLLPGDQINPDDPRRWILIKREMPVPDPNTGDDRWSIDLLVGDQDAVPTFVECKRFGDTRARREVIGQMLEYVANGHHYWIKEQLRDFAEESAKACGCDLEESLRSVIPDLESVDAYFERLQENLREAQVRLVFYLEESPMELRSLVDFLNKQMERSEVLLVEARQYEMNGTRIVVPTLFGYTEEARRAKRTVNVSASVTRGKWDRESFLAKALEDHDADRALRIEQIFDTFVSLGCQVTWGKGRDTATCIFRDPRICPKSLFSINHKCELGLPFAGLNDDPQSQEYQRQLQGIVVGMGMSLPADWKDKWLNFKYEDWSQKIDMFLEAFPGLMNTDV